MRAPKKPAAVVAATVSLMMFCGATAGRPPDVVLFLADDLGYSDLASYGGEIRTPNIDRLACGGVRFRNFHNAARCSPTRMALLSGLHPQQIMTDPAGSTPPARLDGNIFLSEILSTAGYRTYLSGKWHLGGAQEQTPWTRGFQHVFAPVKLGSGTIDYWNANAWALFRPPPSHSHRHTGRGFYATDAIGEHARAFLHSHFSNDASSPFFLYVAFNAPHFYLAAPKAVIESTPDGSRPYPAIYADGWNVVREERYRRMRNLGVLGPHRSLPPMSDVLPEDAGGDVKPVPPWQTLPADRRADLARRMAVYAASVERLDAAVGQVMRTIETAGRLENTLVFFLSDNGGCAEGGVFGWARSRNDGPRVADHAPLTGKDLAEMGGPGRADLLSLGGGWADVCNTPYRFYKQQVHEGGIRTPLIMHWPAGRFVTGSWSDQNGHVIDVLPTVLDATGATYPAEHRGQPLFEAEGISLLSACRGVRPMPRSLGYEHLGNRAWVEGNWKLVTKKFPSADGSKPGDAVELYDLSTDPTETRDLASELPDRARAMATAWNRWAARVGVVPSRYFTPPLIHPERIRTKP